MKLWLRNAILRLTTEYTGIHRCPIIRKLVHEGDWENRERSASLRQDRCCEVEPKPLPLAFLPRRGAGDEAESEDLPVESAYLVLRTKEQYDPRRCGRRGFIAAIPEARLQTDRWVNDLAMPPFEECVGFPKRTAHPAQSHTQDMLDVDSACSVFLLRPPGSADASSRRFPLFRLREAAQSHTTDD